jgi:hypothetical protein
MSGKPKSSDYEASAAEKMSASIAKADKDYFNENYGPILREMRDQSETEDLASVGRGRGNADLAQTLDKPSLQATKSVDAAADRASAGSAQMAQAQFQGLQAQRQRQIGVLATARGQQAEASMGLSKVAKIANSATLQSAKRKQMIRDSNVAAGLKLGQTFVTQGIANKASGGFGDDATFFSPGTDTQRESARMKGWSTLGTMIGGV